MDTLYGTGTCKPREESSGEKVVDLRRSLEASTEGSGMDHIAHYEIYLAARKLVSLATTPSMRDLTRTLAHTSIVPICRQICELSSL